MSSNKSPCSAACRSAVDGSPLCPVLEREGMSNSYQALADCEQRQLVDVLKRYHGVTLDDQPAAARLSYEDLAGRCGYYLTRVVSRNHARITAQRTQERDWLRQLRTLYQGTRVTTDRGVVSPQIVRLECRVAEQSRAMYQLEREAADAVLILVSRGELRSGDPIVIRGERYTFSVNGPHIPRIEY